MFLRGGFGSRVDPWGRERKIPGVFLPPKRSSWITRATTSRTGKIEAVDFDDEAIFEDLDPDPSDGAVGAAGDAVGASKDAASHASVAKIVADLEEMLGPGKVSVRGSDLEEHAADIGIPDHPISP